MEDWQVVPGGAVQVKLAAEAVVARRRRRRRAAGTARRAGGDGSGMVDEGKGELETGNARFGRV
jgi:hypothetical protein